MGLFKTRLDTERVVMELQKIGIDIKLISALLPFQSHYGEDVRLEGFFSMNMSGVLAQLSDICKLQIPQIGYFIGAGPFLDQLVDENHSHYDDDVENCYELSTVLSELHVPSYTAKRFEGSLRSSQFLVCVHFYNMLFMDDVKECFIENGVTELIMIDNSMNEIKNIKNNPFINTDFNFFDPF